MQALLILLICLVALAIAACRYGVDSRDGLDWSPPDRARSRGRRGWERPTFRRRRPAMGATQP
jgi:hypothetical protein